MSIALETLTNGSSFNQNLLAFAKRIESSPTIQYSKEFVIMDDLQILLNVMKQHNVNMRWLNVRNARNAFTFQFIVENPARFEQIIREQHRLNPRETMFILKDYSTRVVFVTVPESSQSRPGLFLDLYNKIISFQSPYGTKKKMSVDYFESITTDEALGFVVDVNAEVFI